MLHAACAILPVGDQIVDDCWIGKFGVRSKVECRYRLLDAMRTVLKAEPIEIGRHTSITEARQTMFPPACGFSV
ncbi:hypothetical protein R1521_32040 [Rhizobium brockwellii]|uniref:Uncharacterized protein n=1 Tax=Rhizobium brockwellii TaxID=3019932 RepID=A0ABU3YVV6_9HYPH|nr:hypothetical protein [Rhizobium brockwellii]MDV4183140.1 hypothetical protein [Rhizobium brockwellii]MDV4189977.1 hypothetical protein [Rhizobium brockwellii]